MKSDFLKVENTHKLSPPGNIFNNKKYNNFSFGIILRDVVLRKRPTFKKELSEEGFDLNCESLCRTCEPIIILDMLPKNKFCFIKTRSSYGFIPVSHIALTHKNYAFAFFTSSKMLYVTGKFAVTLPSQCENVSKVFLSFGSVIPYVDKNDISVTVLLPKKQKNGGVIWQKALIEISSDISLSPVPFTPKNLVDLCKNMLGFPYDWGESFGGCDCSSLINSALFLCGKYFPRNTRDMFLLNGTDVTQGEIHQILSRCKKGDILLCPGHVMLYMGKIKGEFYALHSFYAKKCVMITSLNELSGNGVPLINLIKKIIPFDSLR